MGSGGPGTGPGGRSRGFTVLEVLVAVTILFTVLMSGTLAYRSAVRLLEHLNGRIELEGAALASRDLVRLAIGDGRLEGAGSIPPDIEYLWEAKEVRSSRNVVAAMSELNPAEREYGRFDVTLFEVQLTVRFLHEDSQQRDYRYAELLWSEVPGAGSPELFPAFPGRF